MIIDLVCLTETQDLPDWSSGSIWMIGPTPKQIKDCLQINLPTSKADAWLFWDINLGVPNEQAILQCLNLPGDLWHAGLKLGMNGQPGLIDFVQPTWMLNRDADPNIISTSWRISLRACLVKTEVLRQIGGPDPEFLTLAGAGLDWGLRLLKAGVIPRYTPYLNSGYTKDGENLPLSDELRILYNWTKPFWVKWALMLAIGHQQITIRQAKQAARSVFSSPRSETPPRYTRVTLPVEIDPSTRVSLIIPTIQRYPYLRVLLEQLRHQTVAPTEIILIDQTPVIERDLDMVNDFADLPLKVIYLDKPGQCTARNIGIKNSSGDYLLFLDDDVEVQPDTIEKHLNTILSFKAEVSAGTVHEPGEQDLSSRTPVVQVSSVLPTGNVMLKKEVLNKTGLFDLAYDHGARADGDLGMRLYLKGALIIQNLSNDILHHHAPRGGLREHRARVITAKQSKSSWTKLVTPSVTEYYLAMRYFSEHQVRNLKTILTLAPFRNEKNGITCIAHLLIRIVQLPSYLIRMKKNVTKARRMLEKFPQIPKLHE